MHGEKNLSEKQIPPSPADYSGNLKLKNKLTTLDEIDKLIDWITIERKLKKALKRSINAAGKPAYPCLVMFTSLILQRLYNLIDVELEEQLR